MTLIKGIHYIEKKFKMLGNSILDTNFFIKTDDPSIFNRNVWNIFEKLLILTF